MGATPNYHDVADFEEAWTLEQAGPLSDKELAHRLVNELDKLLFQYAGLDFYQATRYRANLPLEPFCVTVPCQ